MTDLESKAALRQRLADMAAGACGGKIEWTAMVWDECQRVGRAIHEVFGVFPRKMTTLDAAVDWLWERGLRA